MAPTSGLVNQFSATSPQNKDKSHSWNSASQRQTDGREQDSLRAACDIRPPAVHPSTPDKASVGPSRGQDRGVLSLPLMFLLLPDRFRVLLLEHPTHPGFSSPIVSASGDSGLLRPTLVRLPGR